jgi:hypothetical protein
MIHALTSLNPIAILVVSVLCFLIGGVWYSPLLFVRAWMKEMKMTQEEMMAKSKGMARTMGCALLLTLASTVTLATLLSGCHVSGVVKGAAFGLLVGAGVLAAREGVNALFEQRTLRHFMIVAGHDVVLFVIQGAILGFWR